MYMSLFFGKYSVAVVLMPSVSVVFEMVVFSRDCPMMETCDGLNVVFPCSSPVSLVKSYSPFGRNMMKRLDSLAPDAEALAIAALKSPSTPTTKSKPCFAIAKAFVATANVAHKNTDTLPFNIKPLNQTFLGDSRLRENDDVTVMSVSVAGMTIPLSP